MAAPRLQKLVAKRDAMNALIRQEQVKLNARTRRADTRRKVLAGAAVLEWAKEDSEFSSRLMMKLKTFLVRDGDRALFGLPPLPAGDGQQRSTPDRAA